LIWKKRNDCSSRQWINFTEPTNRRLKNQLKPISRPQDHAAADKKKSDSVSDLVLFEDNFREIEALIRNLRKVFVMELRLLKKHKNLIRRTNKNFERKRSLVFHFGA
jgi:hypothetical protein